MYHSWTTFVLLLWALILWMVPNKRASMMKCSPFIVFYATLLLLGQYVYSMDLNDQELPREVNGINISEIGFIKADKLSRWHLIVKVSRHLVLSLSLEDFVSVKYIQIYFHQDLNGIISINTHISTTLSSYAI